MYVYSNLLQISFVTFISYHVYNKMKIIHKNIFY